MAKKKFWHDEKLNLLDFNEFGIKRSGNKCRLRFYGLKHEWIQFGTLICDQSWPQKLPKKLSIELTEKM